MTGDIIVGLTPCFQAGEMSIIVFSREIIKTDDPNSLSNQLVFSSVCDLIFFMCNKIDTNVA